MHWEPEHRPQAELQAKVHKAYVGYASGSRRALSSPPHKHSMTICWDVIAIVVSFLSRQDLARFMLTSWYSHNLAARHLYTRLVIKEDSKTLLSIDPKRTHYAKLIKQLTITKWAVQAASHADQLARALTQCAGQLDHLDIGLLGLEEGSDSQLERALVFPSLRALKAIRPRIAQAVIDQGRPQLEALHVDCDIGPMTPEEWADLYKALAISSASSLRHLQVAIQTSDIGAVSSELRKIVEAFPCLSLLCMDVSITPFPVGNYTWNMLKVRPQLS